MSSIEARPTAGIIGSGNFGPVVAKHLIRPGTDTVIYDPRPDARFPDHRYATSVDDIGQVLEADQIFIATYLSEEVLDMLVNDVPSETALVHLGSTQSKDRIAFQDRGLLDRPDVLMSHPLFGPDAMRKVARRKIEEGRKLEDKSIVITTKDHEHGPRSEALITYWASLAADIVNLSAKEHDVAMKDHALAFFIGEAISRYSFFPNTLLETPTIKTVKEVKKGTSNKSPQLFDNIEERNPFASEARIEFMEIMAKLNSEILIEAMPFGNRTDLPIRGEELRAQMIQVARTLIYGSRLLVQLSKHENTVMRADGALPIEVPDADIITALQIEALGLDLPLEPLEDYLQSLFTRGYQESRATLPESDLEGPIVLAETQSA